MKRSLRKWPVFIALAAVLALTGCSSNEYLEYESTYQAVSDYYIEALASMDVDEIEALAEDLNDNYDYYEEYFAVYPILYSSQLQFTLDAQIELYESYASSADEMGDYIGVKEYEGGTTDSDGNVTYSVVYEYTDHNVRVSMEYNEDNIVETVTVDPIYSVGEIAVKAGLNTIIGMGTVFVVLIILCILISCFKYINIFENKMAEKKKAKENAKKTAASAAAKPAAAPAKKPAAAPKPAVAAAPAEDTQLIAVIAAAIAAAEGTSPDGLVIRSIRRRDTNKWKKA